MALAYTMEAYSFINFTNWDTLIGYMTEATINKAGDFYRQFGEAGLYIEGAERLFVSV